MKVKGILTIVVFAMLGLYAASCAKKFQPVLSSDRGVNFKVISLEQAKELSRAANKPLFVFTHASWCPTCKKMEQEVLIKKELGDVYNNEFINVAIDLDSPEGKHLNKLYPITATPTLFFFKPNGMLAQKYEGFESADDLLSKARLF